MYEVYRSGIENEDKIEKMSYEEFITFQTYNDKLIDFLKKKRDLFFHVSINKKFNVNKILSKQVMYSTIVKSLLFTINQIIINLY